MIGVVFFCDLFVWLLVLVVECNCGLIFDVLWCVLLVSGSVFEIVSGIG